MATRIRLQRKGKKRAPYYHIVVADGRAKRDGRYIERLGFYNPNTDPATIEIDFESAVKWIGTGAQPSDTARAILSYKGVMMKDHLNRGVKKGALTQEQANAKFDKWLSEKTASVESKKAKLAKSADSDLKTRMAKETEVKEARSNEIAKRDSDMAAEAAAAVEASAAAIKEASEAKAEEVAKTEAPKAETEVKAEEPKAAEEAPKAEAKTEGAPKEEAPKTETDKPKEDGKKS